MDSNPQTTVLLEKNLCLHSLEWKTPSTFLLHFLKKKESKGVSSSKANVLSRYSTFKAEPEKPEWEQRYLDALDTSIELTTFYIFIIDTSFWVLTGRWDKNILKFSVTHMFHLELVAEAAGRNQTFKGNIWTLIKSCHSLIAFPKAANYKNNLIFIGSMWWQ